MGRKLTGLKDILWALCIFVSLGALVIGLFTAATRKYSGEQSSGRVELDISEEAPADYAEPQKTGDGTLHTVPETKNLGQDYIDGLTFLCDSSLIGLRDYGVLADGIQTTQVWGSAAGNMPVENLASCTIKYMQDGSVITPAEAASIRKPSTLIVSLGMDGLAASDHDSFVNNYESLIRSIQSASPSTNVVCLTLTSVVPNYSGVDGLDSVKVADANDWLVEVCADTGAYYADAAKTVKSSGYLMSDYAASNGKALNTEGLKVILEYLMVHAI